MGSVRDMPVLENMNLGIDNVMPEGEKPGVTAQEVYSKSWNFGKILNPQKVEGGVRLSPDEFRAKSEVKRLDETIREDLGWHAASPLKTVDLSKHGDGEMLNSKPGLGARMKPSKYDGLTSYEDYQIQFEMLAQLNGWTKDVKALYLAGSLRRRTWGTITRYLFRYRF
jgi:hypothetical protein